MPVREFQDEAMEASSFGVDAVGERQRAPVMLRRLAGNEETQASAPPRLL
jgi:hypothetical protein